MADIQDKNGIDTHRHTAELKKGVQKIQDVTAEEIRESPSPKTQSSDVTLEMTSRNFHPVVAEAKAEGSRESLTQGEIESIMISIRKHFVKFADKEERISESNFKLALGPKKDSFFAERFFHFLDNDHNGYIDMIELTWGATVLLAGNTTEKLGFIFQMYNVDGSGIIERNELRQVLTSCVLESHMHLNESMIATLTDALFEEADSDKDDKLSKEELSALLEKYPDVLDNLTSSAASWLQPTFKSDKATVQKHRWFSRRYIKNNGKKLSFIAMFWFLNAMFFCINAALYRHSNPWIIFARGCGMCLDFDSALVLLLPLRLCLTYLRNTPLTHVLPLDHNIYLHKMVGFAIVFWSVLHTIGHLGNAVEYLSPSLNLSLPVILFTLEADVGWVAGLAPVTGVVLLVIVLVMMVASLPFVRRSGHFQIFYLTHRLYIPYYIFCILHATHFWKWFLLSGVIFLIETLLAYLFSHRGGVFVQEVSLLSSGVTQMTISRPQGFKFSAGDYVYLKMPVIATHEWHPFTISSAPETQDIFTVHIRSAGHWTNKVRQYFLTHYSVTDGEGNISNQSLKERRASSVAWFASRTSVARAIDSSIRRRTITKIVHVPISVDGPYGSASRDIFDTEHAILIGSGIGVTPFASILQSIMHRFQAGCITCPECNHRWSSDTAGWMKLQKVDFIWINRDQRHFEWFTSLLSKIESEQAKEPRLKDAITMYMFMTGAPSRNEVQGIGVQVALDIVHHVEKTDLITGLKTRTQAGRPDFDKLLQDMKEGSPGKPKVFMCGSPSLAKSIKHCCMRHNIPFFKEQF